MKQYISTSQLKDKAKIQLSGKYHGVISACFMVQVLTYLITVFVSDLLPTEGLIWFAVSILVSTILTALTGVFQTGLAYMFLNIACNKQAASNNIFYGFYESYEVSVKVSFVHAFLQLICQTPCQILLLFALVFWILHNKYNQTVFVFHCLPYFPCCHKWQDFLF